MKTKQALLAASILLFTSCSGTADNEASVETTGSTTDAARPLTITQSLQPLTPSEVVIPPPLVSEIAGAVAPGESEVSSSDIARQEGLLNELSAQRNQQGILLTIPELVLFDFNSTDLRPEADAQIAKIVELLPFYPENQVKIAGHTDNVGSDADNQRLSERRAEVVREALIRAGAPAARLSAEGFGEKRPVASNTKSNGGDDPEGRQKNRRVEIILEGA